MPRSTNEFDERIYDEIYEIFYDEMYEELYALVYSTLYSCDHLSSLRAVNLNL